MDVIRFRPLAGINASLTIKMPIDVKLYNLVSVPLRGLMPL